MTWNYRILRHPDGAERLHEVYYRDNGSIRAWTADPAWPVQTWETAERLNATKKARALPILILADLESQICGSPRRDAIPAQH